MFVFFVKFYFTTESSHLFGGYANDTLISCQAKWPEGNKETEHHDSECFVIDAAPLVL